MPSSVPDPAQPATLPKAERGLALPVPVVLVLQGGGALGANQAGVYEAMHEVGIEPDWVIGTSIGAINAALIVGNSPAHRLDRLREFWRTIAYPGSANAWLGAGVLAWNRLAAVAQGVPGFFSPNPPAWLGPQWPLAETNTGYYRTQALHDTLAGLTDAQLLTAGKPRLTVGAVQVDSGQMHHMRHIVRELASALPEASRRQPLMQSLAAYGCGTVMHLMSLTAPRLPDEDSSKDLDFNEQRIQARWQAGLQDMRLTLRRQAWTDPFDPMLGLVVHDAPGPEHPGAGSASAQAGAAHSGEAA